MVLTSVIMHLDTAVPASGPARLTMQTSAPLCDPDHLSAQIVGCLSKGRLECSSSCSGMLTLAARRASPPELRSKQRLP